MFTALIHQKIVPDIILAADVVCVIPSLYEISIQLLNQVFDPSVIPALVGTLKIALQTDTDAPYKQPKVALIALTVRNKDTVELFLNHSRGILKLFLKLNAQYLPRQTSEAALHLEDLELGFHVPSSLETMEDIKSCQNVKIFRITLTHPYIKV